MNNSFFGSKLNTVLLFFLIIIVGVAIFMMFKNKETYLPIIDEKEYKAEVNNKMPSIENRNLISGRAEDLIGFSISPNSKVKGVVSYRGTIKGGYFFEGNILVGVTDINKKIVLQSNAVAQGEWMTTEPVSFEGNLDFSKLAKGPAYIQIHNDNASGLKENDKIIYVPIIIE
jgi:hypothetical protein